jgi:hypothetical protein
MQRRSRGHSTNWGLCFFALCQEDGLSESETAKTLPKEEGVDALNELALNLHWSWNHGADEVWKNLDAELWATTQNPWVILQTVSRPSRQLASAQS